MYNYKPMQSSYDLRKNQISAMKFRYHLTFIIRRIKRYFYVKCLINYTGFSATFDVSFLLMLYVKIRYVFLSKMNNNALN